MEVKTAEYNKLLKEDPLKLLELEYLIPKDPVHFDNEVYYPVYKKLFDEAIRYIHLWGGRGSAKSYEGCGKLPVVLMLLLPFCRILGIRRYKNTIKTSMFQEVCDYISYWGLDDEFHITRSPLFVLHKRSGNFMNFEGLDKPASIKSYKDLTHVIVEEATQSQNELELDVVDKTVRTKRFDNAKIIMMYNPDNINHYIYKIWHDQSPAAIKRYERKRDKTYMLKTSYKNNKYVSADFVELLEQDKISNPERYKVDAEGEWGRLMLQGLFYHNYNSALIEEDGLFERVYDKSKPLYITLDYNVYPYITLIVNQLNHRSDTNELEVCSVREYCITDIIKTEHTLRMFLNDFYAHEGEVIVTGDRAGHNRKPNAFSDFGTVFLMLRKTPVEYYISGIDQRSGLETKIDPYPDYERLGCDFKVIDATQGLSTEDIKKKQNAQLKDRQMFFEKLHAGQLMVLPAHRDYKTINSSGQIRQMSSLYANCKIVQKIDTTCVCLIRDYVEVQSDPVKGGKSDRVKEITHTSDSIDYLYDTLFEAEMELFKNLRRN